MDASCTPVSDEKTIDACETDPVKGPTCRSHPGCTPVSSPLMRPSRMLRVASVVFPAVPLSHTKGSPASKRVCRSMSAADSTFCPSYEERTDPLICVKDSAWPDPNCILHDSRFCVSNTALISPLRTLPSVIFISHSPRQTGSD